MRNLFSEKGSEKFLTKSSTNLVVVLAVICMTAKLIIENMLNNILSMNKIEGKYNGIYF
jgi:preprotein translocase subunit SecG